VTKSHLPKTTLHTYFADFDSHKCNVKFPCSVISLCNSFLLSFSLVITAPMFGANICDRIDNATLKVLYKSTLKVDDPYREQAKCPPFLVQTASRIMKKLGPGTNKFRSTKHLASYFPPPDAVLEVCRSCPEHQAMVNCACKLISGPACCVASRMNPAYVPGPPLQGAAGGLWRGFI
jgi:hypothetical protein